MIINMCRYCYLTKLNLQLSNKACVLCIARLLEALFRLLKRALIYA